jgi:hypothetical protein
LPNLRWGPNPTITPYMTTAASHIKWPRLTKHEVEHAIFRSSPDKALGLDEISFRVWREL